jgi:hypothetical protein
MHSDCQETIPKTFGFLLSTLEYSYHSVANQGIIGGGKKEM